MASMKPLLMDTFAPEGFLSAFFEQAPANGEQFSRDQKRALFFHLFYDMYYTAGDLNVDFSVGTDTDLQTSALLRVFLTNADNRIETGFFLHAIGDNGFINRSMSEHVAGYLSDHDYEQFYLYLYRMDCLWHAKRSPSGTQQLGDFTDSLRNSKLKSIQEVMHKRLAAFLEKDEDGESPLDICYQEIATDSRDEIKRKAKEYFAYIEAFSQGIVSASGKKKSERISAKSIAYSLMVLWSVINVYAICFLPAIENIILYQEDPTTQFDESKQYIIKSALNDNLYLSVLKTYEPLTCTDSGYEMRELLFSVNAGKLHRPSSLVEFVKCADFDGRDPGSAPAQPPHFDPNELSEEEKGFFANLVQKIKRKIQSDPDLNPPPSLLDKIKGLFSRKTESYYLLVNGLFLTYEGWFSGTRISLKEEREASSRWCFSDAPATVAIFNAGQWANFFALDIPNGGQFSQTLMWCFPSFSQKAQRFTVHEVLDWKPNLEKVRELRNL